METTGGRGRGRGVFWTLLAAAVVSVIALLTLRKEGGDLAQQTNRYLEDRKVRPLSGALDQLLADAAAHHVPTQAHPLLKKAAPELRLSDHQWKEWTLGGERAKGPVVVVFYYGYVCTHCVGQLFAINKDIEKFRELGAQVLAVSPDRPEVTLERFAQFGPFQFPVVSDPANKVAAAYGAFEPARGEAPEKKQHGTFIVDRDGSVTWAFLGDEPFTDNKTLLYELAVLTGRAPRKTAQK